MDHKYKEEPGGCDENWISETVIKEVRKFYPDFKVPEGFKVRPDSECNDQVDLVIASRYNGHNAIMQTDIPWSLARCIHCNHEVIVSDSSPKAPRICIECAIKEGRITDEDLERIKKA